MTDATTHVHRHAHDDAAAAHAHAHARKTPREISALERSAFARLAGICLVLSALWAGVIWALH